jgi:octaprenyl-diphosphate synthase
MKLTDIQSPIAAEMEVFEKKFRSFMKTDIFLLDKIMGYIIRSKGKQVRPMFVFLTAGLCGEINEKTHRGAALVELLHTATLVHDDVVDDANYRRGFFSVNALWKNKIAVLVGDYLLARGLLLSIDNEDFALLKIISNAVREMSEGEILQIEKARKLDIDEKIYFEIIRQKTATLIAACCGVGAASTETDAETVKKLIAFGETVGIAFQIKDDLFDYGNSEVGKPLGIDIKEKKMTLPLIYALNKSLPAERKRIINLVKNQSHRNEKVQEVIEFVKKSGGIEYTKTVMMKYFHESVKMLDEFEDNIFKSSLISLVKFSIEREK